MTNTSDSRIQMASLRRALRTAEADADRLGESNDEQCDRIFTLEREIRTVVASNETLREELRDAKKWNAETLNENNRLDKELEIERDRATDLLSDKKQLEAELAAHATITVPPGVPPLDELAMLAHDTLYPTPSLDWHGETKQCQANWMKAAAAIRDRVVAALALCPPPSREEMAVMIFEKWNGSSTDWLEWHNKSFFFDIADAILALFAGCQPATDIGDPGPLVLVPKEPIATPETLEELAEIAGKYYAAHRTRDGVWEGLCAAILHAAQAYVEFADEDYQKAAFDWWREHSPNSKNMLNQDRDLADWWLDHIAYMADSRIRYRVALPPKELPNAEWLSDILKTVPALHHQSKLMNLQLAEKLLAALHPWLHTPVGWELDVTAAEAETLYYETDSGEDEMQEWAAILNLCRSRIRPVYECKECAGWEAKYKELKRWHDRLDGIVDAARAALEGE